MKKHYVFFVLGSIALLFSFVWGVTQNQALEPWTAFISALLYFIGLFINSDSVSSSNDQGDIKQTNFLGAFNANRVKKYWGKARQNNWFSIGNKQVIDNSDAPEKEEEQ